MLTWKTGITPSVRIVRTVSVMTSSIKETPAAVCVRDGEGEEADSGQPNVQERIRNRTFVVATKGLLADPHWIRVSEIFSDKTDSQLLRPLGITSDDPKWDLYTRRLQRVRAITNYQYVI